jgi:hypothetical protein
MATGHGQQASGNPSLIFETVPGTFRLMPVGKRYLLVKLIIIK